MTTSVVVGSVFLASDQLLGVKQLTVGASAHLVCKLTYEYSGQLLGVKQEAVRCVYISRAWFMKVMSTTMYCCNFHTTNNPML